MFLFNIIAVLLFGVLFFAHIESQEKGVYHSNVAKNTNMDCLNTTVVPYPIHDLVKCAAECSRDESCDAFAFNECKQLCHKYCINDNLPGTLVSAFDWTYYKKESTSAGSCTSIKDSKLLTSDHVALLSGWLPGKEFRLLYRATEHGMSGLTFHEICDGKGPTVAIGKDSVSGTTFGGYASVSWTGAGGYKNDSNAFLFRLCGQECTSGIYSQYQNTHQAVFHYRTYSPTFGGGHDLIFFLDNNYTYDSSNGYFASNGYCSTNPKTYNMISGCKYQVKWSDVEVWSVIDEF